MEINVVHRTRRKLAALGTAVAATLTLAAGMLIPPLGSLAWTGTSMLTLHLLMELFAVLIAMLIVVVSWHTLDAHPHRGTHVLIAGFLVVAVCDTAHALTYDGMPDFLQPSSTPRAIFFWLMGRTVEVSTMALLALRWRPPFSRQVWLAFSVLACLALLWLGTWGIALFPVTFVAGQGVTAFKAAYEYGLCLLYLLVAALFWRQALRNNRVRDYLLAVSAFVMGIGEIMFTAYVRPSDFQNVFGHLYKIASYALLYRATFVASLRAPFEALRHSEQRVRESEQRIRSLSDHLPGSMVYRLVQQSADVFQFLYVSEGVKQLYGVEVAEALDNYDLVYRQFDPQDRIVLRREIARSQHEGSNISLTLKMHRADGSLRWIQINSALHLGRTGRPVWDGVHYDITERTLAQQEVERLGFYDALTGLPNRRLLMDRLGQSLASSLRLGRCGALIFMDLDHFKNANDTLGHDLGDALLRQIAQRLAGVVRAGDTVARLGGDEFVVVLGELDLARASSQDQALAIAEKIRQSLSEVYQLSPGNPAEMPGQPIEHHCTASLGLALFDPGQTDLQALLQQADQAMYQAKASGRNRVVLHAGPQPSA